MRRSILKKIKTARRVGRTIRKARSKRTRDARRSSKQGKKYRKKIMKIQKGGNESAVALCDECGWAIVDGKCIRCGKEFMVQTEQTEQTEHQIQFGVIAKYTIPADVPEITSVTYSDSNFSPLSPDKKDAIKLLIEGSLLGKANAKSNLG